MPHERDRAIVELFKKVSALTPLVGVLGHRQVGKTTFIQGQCDRYLSLDQKAELTEAETDPKDFVLKHAPPKSRGSTAIDECQLSPALFPALKEWVRTHPRPGQFVMSGSVRFTSRSAIRESLTGRIMNLELLPMTLSELEGRALPDTFVEALQTDEWSRTRPTGGSLKGRWDRIEQYLEQGGLPGVCFIREPKLREAKINEQLLTLLDRDVRLVQNTLIPFQAIRELCQELAESQGRPVEWAELRRKTGIALGTLKKLLYALEGIFILRTVPIRGGRSGFVCFFEDVAEANALRARPHESSNGLLHFVWTQCRPQFQYRLGESVHFSHYLTRGGANIPLVLHSKRGELGILCVDADAPSASLIPGANSFLKTYPRGKVLILHGGMSPEEEHLAPRILRSPVARWV